MKPDDDHQPACRAPDVDPWVFEATNPHAHAIAKRYCLGDSETPPCPVLDWCHQEFLAARDAANSCAGGPDGTWAGVLYQDGQPKPLRGGPKPRDIHGTDAGYWHHIEVTETQPCVACDTAHTKAEERREQYRQSKQRSRDNKTLEAIERMGALIA